VVLMADEFPEFEVEFVEFLFKQGVLKFGDFTLKSGRKSPYFLNLGEVNTAEGLIQLGDSYAKLISQHVDAGDIPEPTYLFGPAYKGIPIAVATAMRLYDQRGINPRFGADRKETKQHGEVAKFLGAKPTDEDRIVIIEDVFTTGGTKETARENIISVAPHANICGIIIAADRYEALAGSDSTAIAAFREKHGIPTFSVTNAYNLRDILHNKQVEGEIALTDEHKAAMDKYLAEWGVKEE